MITQARLAFRLQRFEILAVAFAALVIGISAIIVRLRLDSVGVPTPCWQQWFGTGGQATGDCETLARQFFSITGDEAGKVMAAMAILPLFIGLFLGIPLVAREIETGTAPTVWALVGARDRWLVGRLVPVVVVLVLSLGFLAAASEFLWLGRQPWGPAVNLSDLGLHGPGVLAKGLAVLGLAVLVGAIIGRTLPAVVIGVLVCFFLYMGAQIAQGLWLQSEARNHVTTSTESPEVLYPGGTYFSQGWIGPDGRLIFDYEEAAALAPAGVDPNEWLYSGPAGGGLAMFQSGVPGSAYPTWSLIETAGLGAVGLVGLGLVFVVVDRRRPQ